MPPEGANRLVFLWQRYRVPAEEQGQLEFQINDRDQDNNDPDTFFEVMVIAAPYSVRADYVKNAGQQPSESQSQSDASDGYTSADPNANVPPPNDSQDCTNPSVSSAYSTECSVIMDRENWESFMEEREAAYERQREEERQKAYEQQQNMP